MSVLTVRGSRAKAAFFLSVVAALLCVLAAMPAQAHATTWTSAMDTVYNKSIKAINDYANQPTKIAVARNGLTRAQAQAVQDRIYYDCECFWIDCVGNDHFDENYLYYTCRYSDATITSMRSKLEAAVKDALSTYKKTSSSAYKIHMLEDWLVHRCSYSDSHDMEYKTAYSALVKGKADCQGLSSGMNLLLNRAGFKTATAVSPEMDHQWNMVKFGGDWYHVDATFANTYTGKAFWKNSICHRWLLLSDSAMKTDHSSWDVFVKGVVVTDVKATKTTYDTWSAAKRFDPQCLSRAKKGSTFKRDGYVCKVLSSKTVTLVRPTATGKKSYTVPASVVCKGFTYKVAGISSGAFSRCKKATTVTVKSTSLAKSKLRSCFKKCKISKVYLPKNKYTAYKKYFKKSICGKSVKCLKG